MEWGARGELPAPRQVNYLSSFCDGDRRTWGRWASRNTEDHLWENFRSFAPGTFGYEWMAEKLWGRATPKERSALQGRPCRSLLHLLRSPLPPRSHPPPPLPLHFPLLFHCCASSLTPKERSALQGRPCRSLL